MLPSHYMTAKKNNTSIAVIILAAGSSSRLGQSKQLLHVDGQPLLQRTVQAAANLGVQDIFVVLGANAEEHKKVITQFPVHVVQNPAWAKGMGNSLKCGVRKVIEKSPDTQAVLVLVCDQPFLTTTHLKKIIDAFETTGDEIITSVYQGIQGVPALFNRHLFEKLLLLGDEQGAKKIIESHKGTMQSIEFPKGEVDLDTPEDLKNFYRSGN